MMAGGDSNRFKQKPGLTAFELAIGIAVAAVLFLGVVLMFMELGPKHHQ